MGSLTIAAFLTLDGVMQAPGGLGEDRDHGFEHGGWSFPYAGDDMREVITEAFGRADCFLLGRRTYEIFAASWPNFPDKDDPVASRLNTLPKYVVSTTLASTDWQPTTIIRGDVAAEVAKLKDRHEGEIQVHGSAALAQTLHACGLVDEYRLFIEPIVLGTGKRLFEPGSTPTALQLIDTRPWTRARCWPSTGRSASRPTESSRWRRASACPNPEAGRGPWLRSHTRRGVARHGSPTRRSRRSGRRPLRVLCRFRATCAHQPCRESEKAQRPGRVRVPGVHGGRGAAWTTLVSPGSPRWPPTAPAPTEARRTSSRRRPGSRATRTPRPHAARPCRSIATSGAPQRRAPRASRSPTRRWRALRLLDESFEVPHQHILAWRTGSQRRRSGAHRAGPSYDRLMSLEWEQTIVDARDPRALGRWWRERARLGRRER